MPDISIDGNSVSDITIDGTSVKEVTIDGNVAWKAIIFKDGFEDNDLSEWSFYDTGGAGSSGTHSSSAPDGGNYHGWVAQNDGSGNWAEIYTDNTFNWDQNYQFEFLVKSDNYDGTDFLQPTTGWRARKGNTDEIQIRYISTDNNGNDVGLKFQGDGVSNTTTHSMNWSSSTWYWIRGEVDESNATAKAKIWQHGDTEPSSYQISCDITTGTGSGPVNMHSNGKSSLNMDNDAAHLKWGTGLF